MGKKLDDDELLEMLQRKENAASHYVHGLLGQERELAMREYHRMPYGNEQEGWSDVVASDVQDSVEWILPALLNIFTSTDKAVSFEPTKAEEVKGAEQATDACNYVFYKQNNGFLVLYTAIKDALIVKNGVIHWRKETQETVSSEPFKGASEEMLAMLLQEGGEIESASPEPAIGPDGQPMMQHVPDEFGNLVAQPVLTYTGRIKKTEQRTICKVESFNPAHLLIEREWASPLLQDCPYVGRLMYVSLSEIRQMGFKDVEASDLKASMLGDGDQDRVIRADRQDGTRQYRQDQGETEDESLTMGWLRIEYILTDIDGDGVVERVCVYRLSDKILKTEIVNHVPFATASPILNPHRWDGLSISDLVRDIQKLHTEILRSTLDNLKLTNNPRTKLLTDANGTPMANLDDLLDSRIGGIIRMRTADAVQDQVIPFAAGAGLPMLEYVQGMRENRTGVSRTSQGLNPDSLNNTATGRQIDQSAAMQRIELIARIFAETLVKPTFQGILKLLTDGDMQKLSFKLRDEFVEYDPNEWRDQYDMTINVGLGTGDKMTQGQMLTMIFQMQQAGMGMGLATPKHLYHTQSKIIENAGFKDVQNFIQDPSTQPPQPQKPDPEQMKLQGQMQIEQMKAQLADQQHQREMQRDIELAKQQQEFQARQDTISKQLEAQAAQHKAEMEAAEKERQRAFEAWKVKIQEENKLLIAQISANTTLQAAQHAAAEAVEEEESAEFPTLDQGH